MLKFRYVKTLDFGEVVIRKSHTDGFEMSLIELSYNENYPKEAYASIRRDWTTNQPFAVLLDENLKEVYA